MEVYLDYSATTPVEKIVLNAMLEWTKSNWGNPSSIHRFGQAAKIKLEESRDLIAARLGCMSKEIIFTSGGTEANNMALIGAARAVKSKGRHIIISAVEHPSVIESVKVLEREGFEITFVPPGKSDAVEAENIFQFLTDSTILVSVMYVNNETGIINQVDKIADLCQEKNIMFHTDAVQAFGKIPFSLKNLKADFLTISAHKIYGPKGIGALFARSGAMIDSISFGGGQEANRRAGTENMTGIAGFGEAVKLLEHAEDDAKKALDLRTYFETELRRRIDNCYIVGETSDRSPYICNIAFKGIANESFLLNLDMAGIAASVGSACSSGSIRQSHVLEAMSLPADILNSALRFSFGMFTTKEEIDYTLDKIEEISLRLRKQ